MTGATRTIVIDGPAGSGKSSTARAVARVLGLPHLDSGALYRGMTWALLEAGIPEARWAELGVQELRSLGLRLETEGPEGDGGPPRFRVEVGGRDPGEALRGDAVTRRVSRVAALPRVREALLDLQRETARRTGIVADGRDMGTVVFPDADLKVFLVADPRERARRRLLQEGHVPDAEALAAEEARLEARDEADAARAIAPLRKAPDAVEIDTTTLDFGAQVERILALAGQGGEDPGTDTA